VYLGLVVAGIVLLPLFLIRDPAPGQRRDTEATND
jgi:hypothetical protein